MSATTGRLAVSDRNRFGVHLGGIRIPADTAATVTETEQMIEQANQVWRQAEIEAEELRQQAYSEGLQTGYDEALAQCAHALSQAHEQAQTFVAQSESRIVRLAVSALQRIIPEIAADNENIARLVWQGVRSAYGQAYINVRVHADKVETVRARLERWLKDQGNRSTVHVIGDPSLAEEDVVVESDAGTVHVGLREQVDVLAEVLHQRAQDVDAGKGG